MTYPDRQGTGERWGVVQVECPDLVRQNVYRKLDAIAAILGFAGLASRGLAMEVVFADLEPGRYASPGFGD